MAGGSGIRAGQAYFELMLKDGKLTKGLQAWKGKLKAFGASVKSIGMKVMGVGLALRAPFEASEAIFSSMGSEMARMSEKTGASVEALSQLGYAAEKSGVDMEGLGNGLKKMEQKLGEALQGNSAAIDSFAKLGISVADLQKLSPDGRLEAIADRISRLKDPALKTAASMEVFGKAGADLLPLLNRGAAGIEALRKEADRLGLTMDGKSAQAALKLAESLATVWKQIKMVAFQIGAAISGPLQNLAERSQKWITVVIKWVKENKAWVIAAGKVATATIAAGAAIVGLSYAISTAGTILGGVAAVLAGIGTAIGVAGSVLAAIVSPIGLVVAAVVGLGSYWLVTSGRMSAAAGSLSTAFGSLKADAIQSFQGIKDALSAGDFRLAAQILWTTLKIEFERGVGALEQNWLEWTGFFQDVWTGATFNLSKTLITAWSGLKEAWQIGLYAMSQAWTNWCQGVGHVWNVTQGLIEKGFNSIKGLLSGTPIGKIRQQNWQVDADTAGANRELDAEAERQRNAQAEKLKQKAVEIERQKQDILADLAHEQQKALDKNSAELIAKEEALDKELLGLRKQLAEQLKEANKKAADLRAEDRKDAKDNDDKKRQDQLEGLRLAQAGTFSAMTAARQLGGTNQPPGKDMSWTGRAHDHWKEVNKNDAAVAEQKKTNSILMQFLGAARNAGMMAAGGWVEMQFN